MYDIYPANRKVEKEMTEKIVFDTNVLISATLWENSVAQKLLFKCIRENIQIFSSQDNN